MSDTQDDPLLGLLTDIADGVATLAALEPIILCTAQRAAGSALDDLGSCTIRADILSMNHETQYSRVFRS